MIGQEYVTGQHCDQCKRGYFSLSANNPQGCAQCYCMGHSAECKASRYYVDQVRNASFSLYNKSCKQAVRLKSEQLTKYGMDVHLSQKQEQLCIEISKNAVGCEFVCDSFPRNNK